MNMRKRIWRMKARNRLKKTGRLEEDFERDVVYYDVDRNIMIQTPSNSGYMLYPYKPYIIVGVPRSYEYGKDKMLMRVSLHLLDDGIEPVGDPSYEWKITKDDIKTIREVLTTPGPYLECFRPGFYWNMWNYSCYVWNEQLSYTTVLNGHQSEEDFIVGVCDKIYHNKENYAPFNTPMPEWKPLQ